MIVRSAGALDVEAIVDVQEQGAVLALGRIFPQERYPFPREAVRRRWLLEIADPATSVHVSVDERGAVTGFAAARADELLHFGTAPSTWGSGLASELHDAVLPLVLDAGGGRARLHVLAEDLRARRFSEKHGWRPTGARSRSSFPPHPELLEHETSCSVARPGPDARVLVDQGPGRPPSPVDAARLSAQLLTGAPSTGAVDVVRHLLAVQAQDPRGFRLAVRARSTGLRAGDVDDALTRERSLVVSWLGRGTLHLVASEDLGWLHALTTPPLLTANLRRLAQEGVPPQDAERGVAAVERALARAGPLRREQLREQVDAAGVRTQGQALVHVLFLATLRGLVVRGPVVAGEQAFVLTRDWLPAPRPVDPDAALGELAVRYLRGHGPAGDRDLARWAGLPLGAARRGLSLVGDRLREVGPGLVDLAGRAHEAVPAPVRLLGAFDPLLLGWTSREPVLGDHVGVVTVNGIFRPVVLVGGRAVGTWRLPGGRMVLEPFTALPGEVGEDLDAEARDVVRFLGFQ